MYVNAILKRRNENSEQSEEVELCACKMLLFVAWTIIPDKQMSTWLSLKLKHINCYEEWD